MSLSSPPAAWAELELEPTADVRAIKRAYARLAKIHRAEDDPQRFQRLRNAYETALQLAAAQADGAAPTAPAADADDGTADTASTAEAASAEAVPPADHAAQTVENWVLQLTAAMNTEEPAAFQAALADCLAHPLASLLPLRARFSHAVLNTFMARSAVSIDAVQHASEVLGWPTDTTLLPPQRDWLQRATYFRIRLQAQALARGIAPETAPEAAVATIAQWLAQHPIDGLEDRPWFELGIMLGLAEPVLAPLPLIDAIAAYFEWTDLAHLTQREPALVNYFLERVYRARHEQSERDFELKLRQYAAGQTGADQGTRAARMAAAALLQQPFNPIKSRLLSLLHPVQVQALQWVDEIETSHPALAGKLDPRALAFWRKPHMDLTSRPFWVVPILFVISALSMAEHLEFGSDGVRPWQIAASLFAGMVGVWLVLLAFHLLLYAAVMLQPGAERVLRDVIAPRARHWAPTLCKPGVLRAVPGMMMSSILLLGGFVFSAHAAYDGYQHEHVIMSLSWFPMSMLLLFWVPPYVRRVKRFILLWRQAA